MIANLYNGLKQQQRGHWYKDYRVELYIWQSETTTKLGTIDVNSAYQRKGIGSAILTTLIAHAKATNRKLVVEGVNNKSAALCQKHGLEFDGYDSYIYKP